MYYLFAYIVKAITIRIRAFAVKNSTAMILLSLTVGGCVFPTLAVSAPTTSNEASSAVDQIILITPDWKPPIAPKAAPKLVEPKITQPKSDVVQTAVPAITATKPLAALPVPPAPAAPFVPPAPQAAVIRKIVQPERVAAPLLVWQASSGSTLHKTVSEWAVKEKYTVLWEAGDLDYPIVSPLSFSGSFEEAVFQIFGLYEKAERNFYVQGWRTQRLIKITERTQVDAQQEGKSL